MQHYFQNLALVVILGATFGYIFAPQIDAAKHAFLRWNARRKRRKLNNPWR